MKHRFGPGPAIRAISAILCILLVLSTLAALVIGGIRLATTKENTAKIIRQTLFQTYTVRPGHPSGEQGSYRAVHPTQVRMASVRLEEESTGVITGILVDWLYDTLSEQYGDALNFTQETVEEFIEQSTLKDDIADLGASLISDFITGENTTQLDDETITSLLMENAELVESHFGIAMEEDKLSAMVSSITASGYVEKLQQDGIGGLLLGSTASGDENPEGTAAPGETKAPDAATPDAPDAPSGNQTVTNPAVELLSSFRKATSSGALIACICVAAVCALLLCVLHWKWLWMALRKIGTGLIIAGLPGMIPAVLALVTAVPFAWMGVLGKVLRMILQITAPLCIGVFAAGLVLVITGTIWKRSAVEKAIMTDAVEGLSETLIGEEPEKELPETQE